MLKKDAYQSIIYYISTAEELLECDFVTVVHTVPMLPVGVVAVCAVLKIMFWWCRLDNLIFHNFKYMLCFP